MKFPKLLLGTLVIVILASCEQGISGVTPTPVVQPEATDQPQVTVEAAVTPSPAPFQFSLPTPGAEPVSGWRPPLYPVPWAMSPYDHFYFARPIAADQVNWPVADYRYGGVFFAPNVVHTGVDIDADEGAPVLAAGAGTVIWAGWGLFTEDPGNEKDPYGQAVAIRHDFGFKGQQLYTIYAHMSEVKAVVGQHVETGDVVGLVGHTGAVTGPHAHFEVRFPNNSFYNTYNPELWIAPPQGWGVLVGRIEDNDDETLQQISVRLKAQNSKLNFLVKTYGGGGAINRDPYYNENMVLGDIPAGIYKLTLDWDGKTRQTWVEIFPGQVTYISFHGDDGFNTKRPPAPTADFLPTEIPPTFTPSPTP
jgi:murein DD-endopeptidase MepM/ murein hydrolase activator NlpD